MNINEHLLAFIWNNEDWFTGLICCTNQILQRHAHLTYITSRKLFTLHTHTHTFIWTQEKKQRLTDWHSALASEIYHKHLQKESSSFNPEFTRADCARAQEPHLILYTELHFILEGVRVSKWGRQRAGGLTDGRKMDAQPPVIAHGLTGARPPALWHGRKS